MALRQRKAMMPPHPRWNAVAMAAALVSWISIGSMQPMHVSAWVMMPRSLSRSPRSAMKNIIQSPLDGLSSSLLAGPPLKISSAPYYAHSRKSRIRMLSSPTPLANDGSAVATAAGDEQAAAPILRSLYDAPPQLPTNGGNETTDNNNNGTAGIENDDTASSSTVGWTTEVTSGTLPTEEGSSHVLYYEVHRRFRRDAKDETNNKRQSSPSLTGLFLHGGPGAGCYPNHVRFFSPELYETVVLLDQRGCGRSTPLGETKNNTLELLVDDVERLRVHLLEKEDAAVRPWDVILGGSWGVTLAMAYAHRFPEHVRAMVLRGVCLFRNQEIDWLFGDPSLSDEGSSVPTSKGGGAGVRTSNLRSLLGAGNAGPSSRDFRTGGVSNAQTVTEPTVTKETTASSVANNTAAQIFPKGWQEFSKGSNIATSSAPAEPTNQRPNKNPRSILQKYYQYLLGDDSSLRMKAVKSWFRWEMGIYSSGFPKEEDIKKAEGKHDKNNNTVLVWNPATTSWAYEDARVQTNQSFASVDADPTEVEEEEVQSLRRFSSSPSLSGSEDSSTPAEPIPILPMVALSDNSVPTPTTSSGKSKNGNKTFDPTTYIPAQSMLTCYYSTNDDYCIGPYQPFLSLTPPSSIPLSSWYSSKLPPQLPNAPSITMPTESVPSTTNSLPLPPTIAIQGGNDAICPPDTSLDLHHVWTEMELRVVLSSGHSMYDPVIAGEIVKALDRFGHELLCAAATPEGER